jgi:Transglutaminase-like superfamily
VTAGRWRRLRAVRAGDWRLFAEAWWTLLWLQPASRFFPFAFLERLVTSRGRLGQTHPGTPTQAERVGLAVARAERYQPWRVLCLGRSLTLQLLLDRRGIASDLRFGVRKDGTALRAHSWVEHEGRPLAESPATLGAYQPLERAP